MHTDPSAASARPVERWFAAYAEDHRHPRNQQLHVLCVPAIVWSILAVLHALPTPAGLVATLPDHGVAAASAALLALAFWWWLSPRLGAGMLLCVVAGFGLNEAILWALGAEVLGVAGVVVFVAAWIGQFVGHRIEGRRPSFFTDLVYLMIGPPWVLAKGYRALGLGW